MPNLLRLTNLFIGFQAIIIFITLFVCGNRKKELKLFLQGSEICTEFRYKLALKNDCLMHTCDISLE